MWKKTTLAAGLLGGLALAALGAEPAPAKEGGKAPAEVRAPRITLYGELLSHRGDGPMDAEWNEWVGPGLDTGPSWFRLDFGGNKGLLGQAGKLFGKRVRVRGRLEVREWKGTAERVEGRSRRITVLVVSDLDPLVEVRGKLTKRTERWGLSGCGPNGDGFICAMGLIDVWEIAIDGKTCQLELGSPHLRALAGRLEGRKILATGVRVGDGILTVVDLQPVEGDYVRKAEAGPAPAPSTPDDSPEGACQFPTKPGTYRRMGWVYTYAIAAKGSKSEMRMGTLVKDGKPVVGSDGEVIDTPLGRFRYFAGDRWSDYNRGWLNTLTYDQPVKFPPSGPKPPAQAP
jgi:hypothetical protein